MKFYILVSVLVFNVYVQESIAQISEMRHETPILDNCEARNFGHIGLKNLMDSTIYVVLTRRYDEEVGHWEIPPGEIRWSKTLYPRDYFHHVFLQDPGRDIRKIISNPNYVYKGRIELMQCENQIVKIEF